MPVRIALTNATGRQAASLARSAAAVGFHISAHIHSSKYSPLVASEIAALPETTIHAGPLDSPQIQEALFKDADVAFINTTSFDKELETGKACADAAKKAGVKHIVYSSMPDHGDAPEAKGKGWHGLPHYRHKWEVEKYIQTIEVPTTFVHTGIYYNNFTSLPFPLFSLREVPWEEAKTWDGGWQDDDSDDESDDHEESNGHAERNGHKTTGRRCGFEWQAPWASDVRLPWLDTEHDFGPAVLQIFVDGPERWAGKRIPLAFDILDPPAVCAAFSRALNRPVRYVEGPIEIKVPVPRGYQEQLEALQDLFGGSKVKGKNAPYWWDGIFDSAAPDIDREDQDLDFDVRLSRALWEGWRDMEGYARDIFPVEERLNGRNWMDEA